MPQGLVPELQERALAPEQELRGAALLVPGLGLRGAVPRPEADTLPAVAAEAGTQLAAAGVEDMPEAGAEVDTAEAAVHPPHMPPATPKPAPKA